MLNHWEIEVINNKRGNKMILFNGHIYNMHRKKLTFIFGVKKKHVKVFLARSLEFMIENLVNHVHDGYLDSNEAVYLARCTKT